MNGTRLWCSEQAEIAASLTTQMGRDRHRGDWVFWPVINPPEE
ncbi:MAG: hypothetical protein M5U20_11870 [Phycisphaerales bacterium]|nr:hypothetical protein [Phycisphaerales bacterium]